jgi:P27 family predicted phage terminase small subunit
MRSRSPSKAGSPRPATNNAKVGSTVNLTASLKLLSGRGGGKDSGGRPVAHPPKFLRAAPDPPEWLDAEARAEWDRVVPGLETLDVLKSEDRAVLAAFCETWSRFVAAVKLYRAEGIVLVNPDSGRAHKHPAVGVAEVAATQLRAFAAEFGLTPAAEQRIGVVTTDDGTRSAYDPYAGDSTRGAQA